MEFNGRNAHATISGCINFIELHERMSQLIENQYNLNKCAPFTKITFLFRLMNMKSIRNNIFVCGSFVTYILERGLDLVKRSF